VSTRISLDALRIVGDEGRLACSGAFDESPQGLRRIARGKEGSPRNAPCVDRPARRSAEVESFNVHLLGTALSQNSLPGR
jgi:hypothetical protein